MEDSFAEKLGKELEVFIRAVDTEIRTVAETANNRLPIGHAYLLNALSNLSLKIIEVTLRINKEINSGERK